MRPTLSPYDPNTPQRFAAEAELIAARVPKACAVEHVGSTAVPGLAGKPAIDIAVGVRSLAKPEVFQGLESIGYSYGGDHGLPQHVFRLAP